MLWTLLWFQVDVVMLLSFIGALAKTLSLLTVAMLVCMAMNVALLYQTALGSSSMVVWAWVSLVEWDIWSRWVLRSGPASSSKWGVGKWAVTSPSTHRANLWVRDGLFSWWVFQFQLNQNFSKAVQCLAFPTAAAELPQPHTGLFSSAFSSPPPKAEGKYSLHVFGHQFCPERVQLAP
jgi:hypothetical protein